MGPVATCTYLVGAPSCYILEWCITSWTTGISSFDCQHVEQPNGLGICCITCIYMYIHVRSYIDTSIGHLCVIDLYLTTPCYTNNCLKNQIGWAPHTYTFMYIHMHSTSFLLSYLVFFCCQGNKSQVIIHLVAYERSVSLPVFNTQVMLQYWSTCCVYTFACIPG